MSRYHKLGDVPRKRHTQFRKPDGTLYAEQVFGAEGFSGIESICTTRIRRPKSPNTSRCRINPSR